MVNCFLDYSFRSLCLASEASRPKNPACNNEASNLRPYGTFSIDLDFTTDVLSLTGLKNFQQTEILLQNHTLMIPFIKLVVWAKVASINPVGI